MSIRNIIFLFSTSILFLGCESSSESNETKNHIPEEKSFPLDQEDVVYDIINATLHELIPKANKTGSTILINERLLVADIKLINDFIDQGGNDLLHGIDRKRTVAKAINIKRIQDFDGIEVLHTYPLNSTEMKDQIGGLIFSRIMLDDTKTKGAFVFHFERLHDKKSKILCAIEVIKKNNKWIIVSKTCLENHPGMLYE